MSTLRLFHERPGVISEGPCWGLLDEMGYLYLADTFVGLVWLVAREWRHDRHLVG